MSSSRMRERPEYGLKLADRIRMLLPMEYEGLLMRLRLDLEHMAHGHGCARFALGS